MRKGIPYGIDNFADLVEGDFAYVDKTRFIKSMERAPHSVSFFSPRRFGKSLFLSTMQYYYDYKYENRFKELFGDTFIGSNPTPDKNKYSVIRFNFSGIKTLNFDNDFSSIVVSTIKDFINVNKICPTNDIEYGNSPSIVLKQFLYYAIRNFKYPLYIMIDEYDNFANDLLGYHTASFKDMVSPGGVMRSFFEQIKVGKGEHLVKKVFLTGVCPITLDSLTSGFNIDMDLSLELPFNEIAGFTRDEAKSLIDETLDKEIFDAGELIGQMTSYYNGYNFCGSGAQKVFNSGIVMYYLARCDMNGKSPSELLDKNVLSDHSKLKALVSLDLGEVNHSVHNQIEDAKARRSDAFVSIIRGEPQLAKITRVFEIIKFTHNDFLSLLFYLGYLTIDSEIGNKVSFVLPNKIIEEVFCDYFTDIYLGPTLGVDNRIYEEAMYQISSKGSNEKFNKCLSDVLGLSPDRIYLNFTEKHFQFLGYIIARGYSGYDVSIEKDVGYGHVDLALLPTGVIVDYYALIELKYIKASDLNPSNVAPEELDGYRMAKIKEKWDEGLAELKKYSQNPKFTQLQEQGRLRKWITIFSTHRCLVNQEIDVNDKNIEMQLLDFEWWFPPRERAKVSRSPRTAKKRKDG
jgi:hypothetical protein